MAYALMRAAFSVLHPIPGALPVDPLPVVAAATRNTLILVPGLLLGDAMGGLPASSMACRVLGLLVLGALRPTMPAGPGYWIAHFNLWTALAPEFRGEFPLTYVYAAAVLQSLLWLAILPVKAVLADLRGLVVPLLLTLLHLGWRAPALWPPPSLGTTGPFGFRLSACALLLLPLFRLLPKPRRGSSSRRRRWMDLAR